jgi:dTDP-4-dehydrorhamnose reductase
MSVLVIGSSGQLASHLREQLPDATFFSRSDVDLSDPRALEAKTRLAWPSAIVNAAAYTAVDKAESERALAWRVNAESPAALAMVAAELNVPLIHISTDYVFDGRGDRPYVESDPTCPINVYGATKLAGELAVTSIAPKHWVLRTSWVFSEHGSNFVKTMLRLAAQRDQLTVVADQRGRPTYAGDLAALIIALLERGETVPFGLHHVGGGPVASWHDFAGRIVERAHGRGLLSRAVPIRPLSTAEYPTPARRPLNSVLQPSPALTALASTNWEVGLEKVLAKLSARPT